MQAGGYFWPRMTLTFALNELAAAAAQVYAAFGHIRCWCFYAPMGSGKTTFVHALCTQVLGVTDAVGSPTFALMNVYQSPVAGELIHMDWYRLADAEEAIDAGIEDALGSKAFCLIEWPEKAAVLLPETYVKIEIELISYAQRRLHAAIVHES